LPLAQSVLFAQAARNGRPVAASLFVAASPFIPASEPPELPPPAPLPPVLPDVAVQLHAP
jgi:hypothetical protein